MEIFSAVATGLVIAFIIGAVWDFFEDKEI